MLLSYSFKKFTVVGDVLLNGSFTGLLKEFQEGVSAITFMYVLLIKASKFIYFFLLELLQVLTPAKFYPAEIRLHGFGCELRCPTQCNSRLPGTFHLQPRDMLQEACSAARSDGVCQTIFRHGG